MSKHSVFALFLTVCLLMTGIPLLTGCSGSGAAAGPKAGQSAGPDQDRADMAHFCLYPDEDGEAFRHDIPIIKERVAALSEGDYIFEETKLTGYTGSGAPAEGTWPALDIYIPEKACSGQPLGEVIRLMLNRPVNLWLGKGNGGVNSNRYFEETLPLSRADLASVKVLEGCPEGVVPFDYGIETDSFLYLELTLTEDYLAANPQIAGWESPSIVHDMTGFDGYYSLELVPAEDGLTYYKLLSGFERGYADALAYDYTHEPLLEGYYILDMPGITWEVPAQDDTARQIAYGDFDRPSYLYVYRMKETVCSEADWEQALQAVRDRLESLRIPYSIGHLTQNERSLALRVPISPCITDLMDNLIIGNHDVSLRVLSENIPIGHEGAAANVMHKDGRYYLELDMSAGQKDVLHKLTSLTSGSGRARISLYLDSWPFMWTYYEDVIRDGKITFDCNAFTGEEGFDEEDRFLLDLAAAFLNGRQFPQSSYSYFDRLTLERVNLAGLDPQGNFAMTGSAVFDYSRYNEKLLSRAAAFTPTGSGTTGAGDFVIQFALPETADRKETIAAAASQLIPDLKDEIFTRDLLLDWRAESGDQIRVACGNSFSNPVKMRLYLFGYNAVTQEELEALADLLMKAPALADLIEIETINAIG